MHLHFNDWPNLNHVERDHQNLLDPIDQLKNKITQLYSEVCNQTTVRVFFPGQLILRGLRQPYNHHYINGNCCPLVDGNLLIDYYMDNHIIIIILWSHMSKLDFSSNSCHLSACIIYHPMNKECSVDTIEQQAHPLSHNKTCHNSKPWDRGEPTSYIQT